MAGTLEIIISASNKKYILQSMIKLFVTTIEVISEITKIIFIPGLSL